MKLAFAMMLTAAVSLTAAESELDKNKQLKAESNELKQQVAQQKTENAAKQTKVETLTTTADLTNGKLQNAPQKEEWKQVYAFEEEKPAEIVKTEKDTKSVCVHRWIKVKCGKCYRFEAEVKLDNVVKTDNVKFGLMVQCEKKCDWPSSFVGAGTFDWKKTSFEYTIPQEKNPERFLLFLYGVEGGFGNMSIRNVRVFEKQ